MPAASYTFGPVQAYQRATLAERDPALLSSHARAFVLHVSPGVHIHESIAIVLPDVVTHLFILVEKGSTVSAHMMFRGVGVLHHTTDVLLRDHASLSLLTVQGMDSRSTVQIRQRARLGNNASMQWRNTTLGGGEGEQDVQSQVLGNDAKSQIDWMFHATDQERQHLSACNAFEGARGSGEIVLQGLAEGHAAVHCNGMIIIGPQGGGTDTYLTEKVLMLDPSAKVDAIPGLEIRTNDVKASHSASVTRVTPEDLFYFAARGIPESIARVLYVQGFLANFFKHVQDPAARKRLQEILSQRCGAMSNIC